MLLLLSHFSRVQLCATPYTAAHQASRPWDSPGKNTGVGCHFLLQCMKVKSESEVAQLCLTLRNPMDCSLPVSSIHGIFQARVLECVAIVFSGKLIWQALNYPFPFIPVACPVWKKICPRNCSLSPMNSPFLPQKAGWKPASRLSVQGAAVLMQLSSLSIQIKRGR